MAEEKTIALLTDFGIKDNYVGIMKGVILSVNPGVRIVDITHEIAPQNVRQAGVTLRTAYRYFPRGSVFLCVVDPGVGTKRAGVIAKTMDYLFVGPDNGLLSFLKEERRSVEFFRIENSQYFLKPVSQTFHGRDIFAPVAAHLSKGVAPARFGSALKDIIRLPLWEAGWDEKSKTLHGHVIDIDHFGNLITNIEESHLRRLVKKPKIHIKHRVIKGLNRDYVTGKEGVPMAIIGSKGYLEIAVNNGSAAGTIKASPGEKVRIT